MTARNTTGVNEVFSAYTQSVRLQQHTLSSISQLWPQYYFLFTIIYFYLFSNTYKQLLACSHAKLRQ